jgi:hypothetical protein
MARFNEILAGRYNRFLQKLFVLKGGPPAPQLSSEVMAVFPLFSGAELRILEGWNRYGVGFTVTANAGTRSGLFIRNPTGSNIIIVIDKFTVFGAAADTPILSYQYTSTADPVAAGSVVNSGLDNRGSATPTAHVGSSNAMGSIVGVTIANCLLSATNENYDFVGTDVQELPLAPGSAYILYSGALNLAIGGNIWWRERSLEESERF